MTDAEAPFTDRVSEWLERRYVNLRYGYRKKCLTLLSWLVTFVFVFPVYWMVITSFKPRSEITSLPQTLYPHDFTTEHYAHLLFDTQFPLFFWNSILVAAGTVVLTVFASVLGGYGLARLDFRFKRIAGNSILFGYMFPALLLGIPLFLIWNEIGIDNTRIGLVLAQTAGTLPFGTWLMWNFFSSVDRSYEEAAWLSGASRPRAFVEVALPKAAPAIIAIIILSFALSWNDFTLALMLITDIELHTLPIGVNTLIDPNFPQWGPLMAGVTLVALPPFLIVLTLQKYILSGFNISKLE